MNAWQNVAWLLAAATSAAALGLTEPGKDRPQIYSPIGKRDPFKQPSNSAGKELLALNPLERFAVEQFQLRAILKGMGKSRAMLEDPEGRSYIVSEGDRIGRERATISKILINEIIVTEKTFNYLGNVSLYEKILSLPPDKEIAQPAPERAGGQDSETRNTASKRP